ncbi:hypothetical protein FGG08_003351 [Glutinoglossum americanum]|uniref:Uncharacterized protein n=1 Tax=Glutinoglossum americanum TaxID=1670608 RepID=A0A9P8I9V1_9PEZI|nr:hypothetical protein FGG08_003351 [Glutinoglossum americanum]
MLTDPRIRQTWNQLSQNLESANESAQANLWTFSQYYLAPCVASLGACIRSCTGPCFPARDERLRRNRRVRGRAENSFDFYDDWDDENDASGGILGWGNDELDRLLAGSNAHGGTVVDGQPGRYRTMSYGARKGDRIPGARRKSAVPPHDGGPDPTIIPNTSAFGFLGRLPWKIGGKGLKYKPSAADLQEHPGAHRVTEEEQEPLVEDAEEASFTGRKRTRIRSNTANSGSTTDSFRSRGDLFPSEDEDDAVPLDDEFAMALEQQRRQHSTDEASSGKTGGKRPSLSRTTTSRTASSNHTNKRRRRRGSSSVVSLTSPHSDIIPGGDNFLFPPSVADLRREEEQVQKEEEREVERKREAAYKLALKCGLTVEDDVASIETMG